ncbi:MAG: class I SAM-dependent methyltransferase [Gammaproteobacteria bacterium]|nr:class I SAM-dependent methyltransferase [Gammaproteobacteria bacterium]
MRRGFNVGVCPICERRTFFYKEGEWLRDQYRCFRCYSIPRWRALMLVLQTEFPDWRKLKIHESSPGGASSFKLARECESYVASHYYHDIPLGEIRDGFRCEDLERQTFPDRNFDLVVSQDVFEHVLDPEKGFAEVARTLRPGGAHVFTVPWYHWQGTLVRAARKDGEVQYLTEPDYHGNPIDPNGSLVVTEWGRDLCQLIYGWSGLRTTVLKHVDPRLGLNGEFLEVFVSRKSHELPHRS